MDYSGGNTVSMSKRDEQPKGPMKLQSVTLNFADNGGVTVRCVHSPANGDRYMGGKSEEHAYSNVGEALDYVESLVADQDGGKSMPDTDGDAADDAGTTDEA